MTRTQYNNAFWAVVQAFDEKTRKLKYPVDIKKASNNPMYR